MKIEDLFTIIPVLETDRIQLRKITPADAEDMFEYASDEMVTRYISYHHYQLSESRERIAWLGEKYDAGQCMVWGIVSKNDHKLIGACAFTHWNIEERIAEIGYTLNRTYWGKGLVREAVRLLFEFGFHTMNLNRIEARCWVENDKSARVMEACNMKFEGTLREQLLNKGKHRDVHIYSILKREF